ncbi:MAG: transcriptional regulator FtrA [Aquimonas sp.]|nr:transcriptional regulator FtrA [Aquimonas sp.]
MPIDQGQLCNSGHRVAAVVYDGLCTFEFGITAEIFGLARPEMGSDWYRFTTAAVSPGPLRAHGGLRVEGDTGLEALESADTIIIPGWRGIDAPVPETLLAALRSAHERGARLASICSGAFVLAATGLLDGRRATTHWRYADALAQAFPAITVDASVLYVDDAPLFTSAGSAAGIDLLLYLVRADHGPTKANMVARRLVMAPHRQGGQAQFVETPVARVHEGKLAPLLENMQADLGREHRIIDLAEAVGMSTRTFLRRFHDVTGTTPGEWLANARVDVAKQLLEEGQVSIKRIALAAGFGSVETLRHHFRTRVGISPGEYREQFSRRPA